MDAINDAINDAMDKMSTRVTGLCEWSPSKLALLYFTGSGICMIVYGYREGVKALRTYLIDEEKNKTRVNSETSIDAVLYGTLNGMGKGMIPSFVWPILLSSYAIIRYNESRIRLDIENQLTQAKRRQ